MRAVKVKEIRRAFREELKKSSTHWIAHPSIYINVQGETMLKYKFQYVTTGGRKLVKLAKKIYKLSGMLPR